MARWYGGTVARWHVEVARHIPHTWHTVKTQNPKCGTVGTIPRAAASLIKTPAARDAMYSDNASLLLPLSKAMASPVKVVTVGCQGQKSRKTGVWEVIEKDCWR